MNLGELRSSDWKLFEERFPKAVAFLRDRALRGEYERLARRDNLNGFERRRLEELTSLFLERGVLA